jgi:hypothetical protein
MPPPPSPELIDGEEEYVVEKILDSRMFRQHLQYLVKWDGYGAEGNTWEYSENVENAPEKVADFHAQNKPGHPMPHMTHGLWLDPFPTHPFHDTNIRSMFF